jgi:hypothetical protein
MSARDEILRRVRAAIGPDVVPPAEVPRDYLITSENGVEMFIERLHHYQATTRRVSREELDASVPATLRERGIRRTVAPEGIPDAWLSETEPLRDTPPIEPRALDAADGVITTCALLPVLLDGVRVADVCFVRILTGLAPGAPLAEQVPAPVELDRHLVQAPAVVGQGVDARGVVLLARDQLMLLLDQRLDPVQHRLVVDHELDPIASWDTRRTMDLELVNFDHPTEVRTFEKGRFELYAVGPTTLGRATYEPGWKWSEHVGAATGERSCQVEHVGLVLSGQAVAKMDDGREVVMRKGDFFYIPPGHDSWVIGDEPYVSLHIMGSETYAAT